MIYYNRFNEFLKGKFNQRVLKICIDGGFTCPNRDGSKSFGGCIFCGERGSGENTNRISIKEQVERYFSSYRSKRANAFIAYFQNFTNTYGTIDELKRKYDEALIDDRIVALSIDTRPDCINEDVCELLNEYQKKYFVYVELGLQTSNEYTHEFINQKINNEDFINAVNLLNKHHIDVVVHIMVGLPNENHEDIIKTVDFLRKINYQGIKIHSTYVIKNTYLEYLLNSNKYQPITLEEYVNELIYILTHIKDDIIIHRLTGDPPKDILVCPEWANHKKRVLIKLEQKMRENNYKQGCFYNKKD